MYFQFFFVFVVFESPFARQVVTVGRRTFDFCKLDTLMSHYLTLHYQINEFVKYTTLSSNYETLRDCVAPLYYLCVSDRRWAQAASRARYLHCVHESAWPA